MSDESVLLILTLTVATTSYLGNFFTIVGILFAVVVAVAMLFILLAVLIKWLFSPDCSCKPKRNVFRFFDD